MSLTSFLRDPEVRDRLAPLRPPIPRKLGAPLLVTPRSGRPTLVGAAFDYLLRFEIHRRVLGAEGRHWVAEHAPAMLSAAADGEIELEVVDGSGPPMYLPPRGGFRRAAKRAEKVLNEARFAAADHALTTSPGTRLTEGRARRRGRPVGPAGCAFVRPVPPERCCLVCSRTRSLERQGQASEALTPTSLTATCWSI